MSDMESTIINFFLSGVSSILDNKRHPEFAVISQDVKNTIKRNKHYHQSITGGTDFLFGMPVFVINGDCEYGIRYK